MLDVRPDPAFRDLTYAEVATALRDPDPHNPVAAEVRRLSDHCLHEVEIEAQNGLGRLPDRLRGAPERLFGRPEVLLGRSPRSAVEAVGARIAVDALALRIRTLGFGT